MSANLYELFHPRIAGCENEVCLERPGAQPLSFGDIDRRCAQLARRLADLGLQPGDRVTVQVDKSAEAVILYLACLRAGLVYNPLNTAYTTTELGYFLADAGSGLLVCDPRRLEPCTQTARDAGVARIETLDTHGGGTLFVGIDTLNPDRAIVARDADDTAAILYTSGTTGRSKGAMISHGNLRSNALALHRIWGWRPGDVLIHALPIYHVHGLFVALHCALLNASRMIFLPRFDAREVLKQLRGATVLMGVPTFYTRLLQEPGLNATACRSMRLFISGSAPLRAETFSAFGARTGYRILERYGMTEAGMITSNPLDGERVPATVGFALPEVQVRVADEHGTVLESDAIGVLEIKGPNVFRGYWRMPEKTAEEFRADGFFITGDLARIDSKGRVTIVGRAKDLIISGGFNVYPKEVEQCLNAIEGVTDSAVFGVPHPDLGEAVVGAVLCADEPPPAETELIERLESDLARFKQPKRIVYIDELPRNAMGKVQKNILRKRYAGLFDS